MIQDRLPFQWVPLSLYDVLLDMILPDQMRWYEGVHVRSLHNIMLLFVKSVEFRIHHLTTFLRYCHHCYIQFDV